MSGPVSVPSPDGVTVRAAGGVVWRRGDVDVEVLVVHRDRYGDWTFPKGKLDEGESWEAAAVREVWEETAVVPLLGPELASTRYVDHRRRPKVVRYWAMTVAADAEFRANVEITDRRWVRPRTALDLLSYRRDHAVLASAVAVAEQST